MNETLEPFVKKLLDGDMKTAEDVAKFIETQTPELGKEIIIWGAISESVTPVIGLLLLFAMLFMHFKYRTCEWYTNTDVEVPGIVLFILGSLLGVFIFLCNITYVVYPLVAPRIYILEKISSLIK